MNTPLNEAIYIRIPVRYKKKGMVLYLYKALYGLKKLPLLWQRYFKSSLIKMGFRTVPHKPYCKIKEGVFIFFYMNDIVFAFYKGKREIIKRVVRKLKKIGINLWAEKNFNGFWGFRFYKIERKRLRG